VTRYDDLSNTPHEYLRKIFTFLGVDPDFQVSSLAPINVTIEPRFRPLHNWLNLSTSNRFRKFVKQKLGSLELAKNTRNLANKLNQRQKSLKDSFPAELQNELMEFYRKDLQSLSLLTGLSFDSWYKE
jgi:(p)ppGpp synthase/HD superfamily hydrolase